jgi:hypothetical protein
MDSATAGLLGAAIGGAASLLGSAVAPWLRDIADRKHQEKRSRATLARDALALLLAAATQQTQTLEQLRASSEREATVIMEIRLLERRYSKEVSEALMYAMTLLRMDPRRLTGVTSILTDVLPAWHAGKIDGLAVRDAVWDAYPFDEVLDADAIRTLYESERGPTRATEDEVSPEPSDESS